MPSSGAARRRGGKAIGTRLTPQLAAALLALCILLSAQAQPVDMQACPYGTEPHADSGRCAYKVAMAVPYRLVSKAARAVGAYLAVEHINTRNASVVPEAALLPEGFRISSVLLDSEFSPSGGVNAAMDAMDFGAVAVVGAARSSATNPLANIMMVSRTPVVSYSSTSPALSSQATFPYFARTIPTDAAAAKSMARLMLTEFEWRRVGMLYVDDSYGSSYFQAFRTGCAIVAEELGLSLDEYEVHGAGVTSKNVEPAMKQMKQLGVYVYTLILIGDTIPSFLRTAKNLGMIGLGYTYITVDSDMAEVLHSPQNYGVSAEEVPVFSRSMQGFLRLYFGSILEPQYSILQEAALERAPALMPQVFHDMLADNGVTQENFFTKGLNADIFAIYAYDAVWSIALALAAAERSVPNWLKEDCGSVNCHGAELMSLLKNNTFTGASGTIKFLAERGDGEDTILLGDRDERYMSLPLEYFNPDAGGWVLVGEMRRGDDADEQRLVINTNITWPGYVEYPKIPLDGSTCEAGWFFSYDSKACEQCAPGTFSSTPKATRCRQCAPGHFCDRPGCTTCDTCAAGSYQELPGTSGCVLCPNNTATDVRGSVALDNCFCREGFYRRDGAYGQPCFECPLGAECHGRSAAPFARMGYWGDWAAVQSSLDDSEASIPLIRDYTFHKCAIAQYCTNDCGLDLPPPGQQSEDAKAALRACRGNTSTICDERYGNTLCAVCSVGYFSLGGLCLACLEPSLPFVIGCILLIITAWYLINRIAAGRYEAVDLMLLFFQNASTISAYSLDWAKFLVTGPFWALAIVNFDVDFFKPDCLNTENRSTWSFGHSLVLQLGLPLIVGLFCCLLYGASLLAIPVCERREQRGRASAAAELNAAWADAEEDGAKKRKGVQGMAGSVGHAALRGVGVATSRAELAELFDDCISAFTSFLNVVYHTMTAKCLETFMCNTLPYGRKYMISAPPIPCWDTWHIGYAVISVLFLVIYTVGIPLAFMGILTYGKVHNLLRNERFMRRFGWLYLRYERQWYWWEFSILMRRGLLVFTLVLAQRLPSLQIILGICICVTAVTMHFYARPFISQSLDTLEQSSLVSLVGLLCTGILFQDSSARAAHSLWEATVTALALLCLFGSMLLVVIMVVRDVRYEEAVSGVQRRMRLGIEQVLNLHAPEMGPAVSGRQQGSGASRAMSVIKSVRTLMKFRVHAEGERSSSDGEEGGADRCLRRRPSAMQRLNIWSRVKAAIQQQPPELHRTVDIKSVEKWLASLKSNPNPKDAAPLIAELVGSPPTAGEQMASLLTKGRRKTSHKDLLPSQMSVTGENLSPKMQAGLIRFWLADHWMNAALSDTSPVSHYSMQPQSVFFGNLVARNPYLLDHMLHADEEEFAKVKMLLNDLRAAQAVFGNEGKLSGLIADIDRGPFLAWMAVAEHHHVVIVRLLLQDLCAAGKPDADDTSGNCCTAEKKGDALAGWMERLLLQYLPKPHRFGFVGESSTGGALDDTTKSAESDDFNDALLRTAGWAVGAADTAASVEGEGGRTTPAVDPRQESTVPDMPIFSMGIKKKRVSIISNSSASGDEDPSSSSALSGRDIGSSGHLRRSASNLSGLEREIVTTGRRSEEVHRRTLVGVSTGLEAFDAQIREMANFGSEMEEYLCKLERKIGAREKLQAKNTRGPRAQGRVRRRSSTGRDSAQQIPVPDETSEVRSCRSSGRSQLN